MTEYGAGGGGVGATGGGGGQPPDQGGDGPPGEDDRQPRRARASVLRAGGWMRRLARLWGFLGFAILVVVLTRHVLLPFVFALLLAFILAPVVHALAIRRDGSRRMPKALAILICYVVLIAAATGSLMVLVPRIAKDATRIGLEAPRLYERLNDVWAAHVSQWLEDRFPVLAPEPEPTPPPVIGDVPMPPGTSFVLTPLPDGRTAVQLVEPGVRVERRPGGGYSVAAQRRVDESPSLEDKIRDWADHVLKGLQEQLGSFVRVGQALVGAVIRTIFAFFLVLMVAAFILIDLDKIHGFARGLFPAQYRDDYDVIVSGIDHGLSGVIRGQLLICLVNGVLTYVGLLIFDIKYALILALVAAILSLIPIFGSILSTIPIVLAALVSSEEGVDVVRALFVLAWIIGIHFLEGNFLNPKIIGSSAKIHPVLVIFALIVGEHSYGLKGALLAVPVASIIQVLFLFFRRKAWRTEHA